MQMQNIIIMFASIYILYRIFLRVRRNIGWQQLNRRKMQVLTIIYFIVGLIFLSEGVFHPISLLSDIGGILIGIILAYCGAVLTRFNKQNGGWQYRPNTWIGSLVTAIFLGRVIYRLYEMFIQGNMGGTQGELTMSDKLAHISYNTGTSWTSGIMLVMFAYYSTYFILLLRKQNRLPKTSSHLK